MWAGVPLEVIPPSVYCDPQVMHAVIFKQSEELWPNVRTAVVSDPAEWLDSRLTSTRKLRSWASGERAVLFPVEEQELGSEASPGDNPGSSVVSRVLGAMDAKATRPGVVLW